MVDLSVLQNLISAGAVLAGAALQQTFSLLEKRAEHKAALRKIRRDKLEEMAELLNKSRLLTLQAISLRANENHKTESAEAVRQSIDEVALRVCSLSLLFFPALKVSSESFLKSLCGLRSALMSEDEDEMISAADLAKNTRTTIELEIEQYAKQLGFHD